MRSANIDQENQAGGLNNLDGRSDVSASTPCGTWSNEIATGFLMAASSATHGACRHGHSQSPDLQQLCSPSE